MLNIAQVMRAFGEATYEPDLAREANCYTLKGHVDGLPFLIEDVEFSPMSDSPCVTHLYIARFVGRQYQTEHLWDAVGWINDILYGRI